MDFVAGELPPARHSDVDAHLACCPACRCEVARLRAVAAGPPIPAPPRPLDTVLREVRAREACLRDHDAELIAIKARAAREIAPFLGHRAADQVLGRVSGQGEDLLFRIESMLALFLGGRAAGELTGHIVDAAIVRS